MRVQTELNGNRLSITSTKLWAFFCRSQTTCVLGFPISSGLSRSRTDFTPKKCGTFGKLCDHLSREYTFSLGLKPGGDDTLRHYPFRLALAVDCGAVDFLSTNIHSCRLTHAQHEVPEAIGSSVDGSDFDCSLKARYGPDAQPPNFWWSLLPTLRTKIDRSS